MSLTWQSPGDSEPKSFLLMPMIQLSLSTLLPPCPVGPDAASSSVEQSIPAHAYTAAASLGFRPLLNIKPASVLCWRRFQQEENAVITGYWNWTLVQNRIEICFVRLECDRCTLCTELPIHAGTGVWITGQGPKKWSSSESLCFHAFKIANQKAMVILKLQPNTSQETKDDLYLIVVLVWTTLEQQTPWLILHTKDKKVSNTISFSLAWMYLAYSSATSVHVSTSSMHCSWFADGE